MDPRSAISIGVILLRPPETKTIPAAPDHITTSGVCGSPAAGALAGRCGYGLRLPFLVISPWAKTNFVDHTLTDQTSSLRFIGRTGAWRPSTNSRNPTIKAPLTG
jgi:phospholipase C